MSSKVILFCALLFSSKFVAPIPFDEELGQQRALQSNSWQGNINTAGQYHASDFTRAHSVNAMTNSAQQYPTGREFETNRGRQHNVNYENNFPHSLHSLPAISNPVKVAPGSANDHRKDGFLSRVDSFPIRNQHHPIRVDNQFKQQNWQSHSRFENPTMGAIDSVAARDSPLSVDKPYHNSGQAIRPPPVNRQHYQGDNFYPKDFRYYPVPQKSGSNRYMDHTRRNSEIHTGPVHYETYHEAQEHNTNIAKSKHNVKVEKVPVLLRSQNPHDYGNFKQPGLKPLNRPGSYIVAPGINNNKNIHVAPINTGINNHPSAPRYPPINHRYNGQPLHTYRHIENPIIHSEPNNRAHDVYYPEVPLDAVLDEGANTRHIHIPIITKEPNNYAPQNTININPIIHKDSALSNIASNDDVILKLTNDDKPSDTTSDDKKTKKKNNIPGENPNENIYDFSEGENVKEYFSDKIQNNFVIIYANGTVEYVKHLDTDDDPDYIVVNKPLVDSPHVTFNSPPGSKQPTVEYVKHLDTDVKHLDTDDDPDYIAVNKPLVDSPHVTFNSPPGSKQPTVEYVKHLDTDVKHLDTDDDPDYIAVNKPLVDSPHITFNSAPGSKLPRVEYVKQLDTDVKYLHTDDDPDYKVVNKSLVDSPHVTFNSPSGSKQPTSNILDSLPEKTNDNDSSTTSSDNNYNKPPLHVEDVNNLSLLSQPLHDNHKNGSISVPELQQNQDRKPLPLLESTVLNKNPHSGPLDDYNPVLGTLASQGHNHNWDSDLHENRQSPSKLLTHLSPTGIHTSTTPASDDALIQEFLDSLSIKPDREQPLSDTNYYSPQDENTPNHDNIAPTGHAHTTIRPSKLHTVISPGIFKSTTLGPDNSEIQKHQDSHPPVTVTSSILHPNKYEESLQGKTTPIPSSSDSDNNPNTAPEEQINTISPIELVTDNVKDGSLPTSEDKEPLEMESVYAKEKNDDSDHDSKSNDTTTLLSSNTHNLHNAETVDNVLTQVTSRVEIEENSTKSACNDSLANTGDPEKYNDNTAASTNQKDVNTDKATGYNSLELKPPKSGLEIKLNIPDDSEGTLYIKVDAPDGYTGNKGTSSNDTLLVSITRQNNSDIDLITVKNDSDGHDYFNTAVTHSDEENSTKKLKLDLSNALVVMNGTTDKEYLNQLLSSDSKVNLFIFQMPCQDQAIVEKSKETTIYPNGTCIELLTETRWKNKDDPSPVIITMKKIYGGGKCN